MKSGSIVLAAGGTGGHIFSALAFANYIKKHNAKVVLLTDNRFNNYRCDDSSQCIEYLPICAPSRGKLVFLKSLMFSYFKAFSLLRKVAPKVIVGFGGYPTLPTLAAGVTLGIPIILHESNAVIGRVNKLFAPLAKFITVACPIVNVESFESKMIYTGNPTTCEVSAHEYEPPGPGGEIYLLVVGGSQGSAFFGSLVPNALIKMSKEFRARLRVYQQCRIENLHELRDLYAKNGIAATVDTFFINIVDLITKAHLVICRAGSGTITELATIGRPAIYIPYPQSRDNHQVENAKCVIKRGGGIMMEEKDLDGEKLHAILEDFFSDPAKLVLMAGKQRVNAGNSGASRNIFRIAQLA